MFDQDPATAEATRRKTYDMLASEKMMVQGFHYPFPAHAYIEKTGDRLSRDDGAVERGDLIASKPANECKRPPPGGLCLRHRTNQANVIARAIAPQPGFAPFAYDPPRPPGARRYQSQGGHP